MLNNRLNGCLPQGDAHTFTHIHTHIYITQYGAHIHTSIKVHKLHNSTHIQSKIMQAIWASQASVQWSLAENAAFTHTQREIRGEMEPVFSPKQSQVQIPSVSIFFLFLPSCLHLHFSHPQMFIHNSLQRQEIGSEYKTQTNIQPRYPNSELKSN